jgi:hypothetical protein
VLLKLWDNIYAAGAESWATGAGKLRNTNKELRFYFSETIINLHSILFWTTRANFEFNQINSQIIWNTLSICNRDIQLCIYRKIMRRFAKINTPVKITTTIMYPEIKLHQLEFGDCWISACFVFCAIHNWWNCPVDPHYSTIIRNWLTKGQPKCQKTSAIFSNQSCCSSFWTWKTFISKGNVI